MKKRLYHTKRLSIYSIILMVVISFFSRDVNAQETGYDNPDNWQFGSDNYWVCTQLVNQSAKTRYADGTVVATSTAYDVTNSLNSDQCGQGWVRLDHREILEVLDESGAVVRRMVWHKGGQDYPSPQPAYGWLDIDDISLFDGTLDVPTADNVPHRNDPQPSTQGMAPVGEPLVAEGTPLGNGVPFWNNTDDKWDTSQKLGKECEAEENIKYSYKMIPTDDDPDGIPRTWQYKKNATSSRYNKYADGGDDYGDGTAEYAWLTWAFLTTSDGETTQPGGGQMRGLIKNGQEFYRCKVKSIKAKAWEYNGTEQIGEITAWYIKTRGNPYSPWMYGWMIAEHRVMNVDGSFGPQISHYNAESNRYEAETASFTLGSIKTGASGQYVDLQNGGEISWSILMSSAGSYTLGFNMSSLSGSRSMGVFVNGTNVGSVTTSSLIYSDQGITAMLNQGINTVELRDTEGTLEPDVDYLTINAIPLTGLSISPTVATLGEGESLQLITTVSPANATYQDMLWSSSNPNVATVSASGLITAISGGSTTITANTSDYSFTVTAEIVVDIPVSTRYEAELADFSLASIKTGASGAYLDLQSGGEISWDISVPEAGYYNLDFNIASPSGTRGMGVFLDGVQIGVVSSSSSTYSNQTIEVILNLGINTIELRDTEGLSEPNVDYLTVNYIPVTGVSVSPAIETLNEGESLQLSEMVSPINATYQNVTWSSSDENVATVSATGLVSAVATGTATITVNTVDGNFLAISTISVTGVSSSNKYEAELAAITSGSVKTGASGQYVDLQSGGEISWGISVASGGSFMLDFNMALPNGSNSRSMGVFVNGTKVGTVTTSSTTYSDQSVTATLNQGSNTVELRDTEGTSEPNVDYLTVNTINTNVPVTGVSVSPTATTLNEGETLQLTETISPVNAANQNVTWTSSDVNVATVSTTGLVSAVVAGTATITVNTVDGSFMATADITVNVPVTGVSVSPTVATLNEGETLQLNETVSPANATNQNVTWTTSDANVATVSATGLVSAVAAGTATITVNTVDGSFMATANITVNAPVTGVSVSPTVASLNEGETLQLNETVSPANATNQNVNWMSSDANVATVSATGLVSAVAAGTATITVNTLDGSYMATADITVNVPVTGVSVSPTVTTLNEGETLQLNETVSPANATNQNVTWTTSDANVATVSATGLVSAVAAGTATITVNTVDGNFMATADITVNAPVTGVSISPTVASLNEGETLQLNETVSPINATNQNVTWTSSDANVATVSATGLVSAVAAGTATITVNTVDGNFSAISTISVTSVSSSNKYEAELAAFTSGSVKTGASGQYVDLKKGGEISWSISVASGSYSLAFNMAIPNGNNSRSMGVFVNGTKVGTVTTSSTTYSDQSVTATLNQGSNTVELRDTEGTSEPNVDYLTVASTSTSARSASLSIENSVQIESNFSDLVKVYPNPLDSGDSLKIDFQGTSLGNTTIEIFDISGKIIYKEVVEKAKGIITIKDIKWTTSFYILRIKNKTNVVYKKIIHI